jgi:hypothetical protein
MQQLHSRNAPLNFENFYYLGNLFFSKTIHLFRVVDLVRDLTSQFTRAAHNMFFVA